MSARATALLALAGESVRTSATAERIRRAREAAGLTQAQASSLAGVTRRSVQRYESGEGGNPFQRQHVLEVLEAEAGRVCRGDSLSGDIGNDT